MLSNIQPDPDCSLVKSGIFGFVTWQRSAGILWAFGVLFLAALAFAPPRPQPGALVPRFIELLTIAPPRERVRPTPAPPPAAARRTRSPARAVPTVIDAVDSPSAAEPEAPALSAAEVFDQAKFFSMKKAVDDARKYDKVLRGGGPPLPEDHPIPRFEQLGRAIAGAVSPDAEPPMGPVTRYQDGGITYTSVTEYGKKRCFMSGPTSRPDGRSDGPRPIKCPTSSSSWRKTN